MYKLICLIALGAIVMSLSLFAARDTPHTSRLLNGEFQNSEIVFHSSLVDMWNIVKQSWQAKRAEPVPTKIIPVESITTANLLKQTNDVLYRLGHSTLLIKLHSKFILIDPIFSERASPVQWAGPKRFHQPPMSVAQLPNISAVIISHDHYDHLDQETILQLADKVDYFVTPLKVGEHLRDWGIAEDKIIELDWWQTRQFSHFKLTATPAQHFSGRGLFDRNETLWASWVIESKDTKLFYSGDGGYFSGFKEIGQRLGPFDFTLMETGAYNTLWQEIHMTPEQSLQAHLDLKGKYIIPVHNATFDLAVHDWFEPLERITALAKAQQVNVLTPRFGEMVLLKNPKKTMAWWHQVMAIPPVAVSQ
jgi:L-ascorbate metabolism protein UlaG (beta-lactamase superfamily)